MSEKQCIIFTDLKDFTYKNTLLTDNQISEILLNFEKIVYERSKQYGISCIKNIGDAYFLLCPDISKSIEFSFSILEDSKKYDETQKIDVKKLSLRITLAYGNVSESPTALHDYFGESINLGSRIMDMTPAGHIFCTSEIIQNNKYTGEYIGDFLFHGFLEENSLYSLTKLSHEEKQRIHDKNNSPLKECEEIIFRASCVSAILSAQPLPFLENINFVLVNLYMLIHIALKFDTVLSVKDASKIFISIVASLGISYITLQGAGTVAKIVLPGIGGYLYVPMSFGVTYALGKVYVLYFYYKISGEDFSPELAKEYFRKHKSDGVKIAKRQKKQILIFGKEYKDDILKMFGKSEKQQIQKDTLNLLAIKK